MKYNVTSLTMSVSPEQIRQFRKETIGYSGVGDVVLRVLLYGSLGVGAILVCLFVIALLAFGNSSLVPALLGFLAAVGVVLIVVLVIRQIQTDSWTKTIRVYQFAVDNGFAYKNRVDTSKYQGMIFQLGHTRMSSHILTGSAGNTPFEFGNYEYMTGSGKNTRSYQYGYIRIQLERHLPHIVLDAIKNNTKIFGFESSNLPAAFYKDQAMRLEGNFNEYFRLYAPKGYEQDALYVFTPDLMALFIDSLSVFDAEIIDDQLFIYTPIGIQYQDAAYVQNILNIIETVGTKTIDRTDRYQDQRVAASEGASVTAEGRRLKKTFSITSIIFTILFTLYIVFQLIQAFS